MGKEQDRIELNKWLIEKGISDEKIHKIICKRAKNPKLIPTEGFEDSSNSWWWEDSPEGEDFWDNVNNVLLGYATEIVYPTHIYDLSDYINVKFDTYFYNSTSGKFVNVLGEEIATSKNKIRLTTTTGIREYFDIGYIKTQLTQPEPKFSETYTSDGEKVSCPKENEIQQGSPVKGEKIAGYLVEWGDTIESHLDGNDVYQTIDAVIEEYSGCNAPEEDDVLTIYKLVPVATIRKVSEIKVETL